MTDEDIWSDTDTPEYPFKTKVFLACLIACGLITAGAIVWECLEDRQSHQETDR